MAKSREKKGMWTITIVFGVLFLLFFIFVILLFGSLSKEQSSENQIGVVEISGPIMSSDKLVREIDDFVRDESIRGILVRIDSPGGTVGASQELRDAVARAADKKAVAISLGNVAASGGFYIAVAGPKVFANPGTVTGSIGVISQFFEVDALLTTLDLQVHTIKSGRFKDSGNPFRDFTPEDEAVYRELIMDIHTQFVEAVAEGRKKPVDAIEPWANGRVFTGRAAHEAGLVDELGGMQDAVDHLSAELDFEGPANLVYPERTSEDLLGMVLNAGVDSLQTRITEAQVPSLQLLYTGPWGASR